MIYIKLWTKTILRLYLDGCRVIYYYQFIIF